MMLRNITMCTALAGLLTGGLLVGCEEAEAPPPYELEISFSPEQPVPGRSTRILVQVVDRQEEPVVGAEEVTFAAGEGAPMVLAEASDAGLYVYEGWVVDAPGEIAWKATVTAERGKAAADGDLSVACSDEIGITNSPCCGDTDCQGGFVCVYGSCRVVPAPADNGCHDDVECASKVCFQCSPDAADCPDGFECSLEPAAGVPVCVREGADVTSAVSLGGTCASAATCDDFRLNQGETDVDCGGDTCAGCAEGLACLVHADCAEGYCSDGLCGLPVTALGTGDGTPGSVTWNLLVSGGDLDKPTDLAFNPVSSQTELWVMSHHNDALIVVGNPGTPEQSQFTIFDKSLHFLDRSMGIAFSPDQNFGTCGASLNQDAPNQQFTPPGFMGPVLWPTDESLIASHSNNLAAAHLDMLHSSPLCMGIAAVEEHQFFVFNGYDGVLDWYDFQEGHVPGGTDHIDGQKRRYKDVSLTFEDGVPSNMVYDGDNGLLYVADTGASRVLKIDPKGSVGSQFLQSWHQDGVLTEFTGTTSEVLVGADVAQKPSGLALHEGILYVSDNLTGTLFAFDTDGVEVARLATHVGAGGLGGITIGPDGLLYLVVMDANEVLRVEP